MAIKRFVWSIYPRELRSVKPDAWCTPVDRLISYRSNRSLKPIEGKKNSLRYYMAFNDFSTRPLNSRSRWAI